MQAQNRSPARFIVEGHSSAFKTTVVWRIDVGKDGIVAKCQTHKRHVSISWEDLLGAALIYGHDHNHHGKTPGEKA